MDDPSVLNFPVFKSKAHKELRNCMQIIVNLKLAQLLGEKKHFEENQIKKGNNEEISQKITKNNISDDSENSDNDESISEKKSDIETIEKDDDLFDCGICIDSFLQVNGYSFGCDHLFCYDCISDYFSNQISEGLVESIKCPETECNKNASEELIEQMVPLPIHERYLKLQIQKGVSAMDDIFYCPNTICNAIVECEEDVGIGSCHVCGHVFCTSCLQEFHGTSDCNLNEHEKREMILKYQLEKRAEEEKLIQQSRIDEENRIQKIAEQAEIAEMARQLEIERENRQVLEKQKQERIKQNKEAELFINKECKKCPGCRSDIQKNEGCNHMTCFNCKTDFCWLCLAKFVNKNTMEQHYTSSNCVLFRYDDIN